MRGHPNFGRVIFLIAYHNFHEASCVGREIVASRAVVLVFPQDQQVSQLTSTRVSELLHTPGETFHLQLQGFALSRRPLFLLWKSIKNNSPHQNNTNIKPEYFQQSDFSQSESCWPESSRWGSKDLDFTSTLIQHFTATAAGLACGAWGFTHWHRVQGDTWHSSAA